MKLKDQVASYELSVRLEKLGISQESLFCYQPIRDSEPSVWPRNFNLDEFATPCKDERVAAFTVAELGEMLPYEILDKYLIIEKCFSNLWSLKYTDEDYLRESILNVTSEHKEANARALMLIYLIENGLYKP